MAGEKFIALEQTSQEIKTAVEGVNTSVTELKEDVGDGAGTDLVTRVASLAVQVGNLQTAVEALASGSGDTELIKLIAPKKNIPSDAELVVLSEYNSNNWVQRGYGTGSGRYILKTPADSSVYLTFTPVLSGKIRAKAIMYCKNASYPAVLYCGTTEICRTDSTSQVEVTGDFDVVAGVEYNFSVGSTGNSSSHYGYLMSLTLCGEWDIDTKVHLYDTNI